MENTKENQIPGEESTSPESQFTFEEQLQLVRDLTSSDGFNKWFEFFYYQGNRTQMEAYQVTSQLAVLVVGRAPIYTSFDSFRRSRSYHLDKERSIKKILNKT